MFPIIGCGIEAVGLLLLGTMQVNTPLIVSALYMFLIGLGLGLRDADARRGGDERRPRRSTWAPPPRAPPSSARSAHRSAWPCSGPSSTTAFSTSCPSTFPPRCCGRCTTSRGTRSPATRSSWPRSPRPIHHGFVEAFSHSLTFMFLVGAPLAAIGFILCWFIPEAPLRESAYMSVGIEDGLADIPPVPDAGAASPTLRS